MPWALSNMREKQTLFWYAMKKHIEPKMKFFVLTTSVTNVISA